MLAMVALRAVHADWRWLSGIDRQWMALAPIESPIAIEVTSTVKRLRVNRESRLPINCGASPRTAADASSALSRLPQDFVLRAKERVQGTRADRGPLPTNSAAFP